MAESVREMLSTYGENLYFVEVAPIDAVLAGDVPSADILLVAVQEGHRYGEAIRELLASGAHPPLVVLTSSAEGADGEALVEAGAADVLVLGTFDAQLLERSVRYAVENARAASAFRKQRDFVSTIMDTVGALIVVLDREGRILNFNRTCEALTGYPESEVLGLPFWDLFLLPADLEPVKAVFRDLIAGRFPSSHENAWIARSGEPRMISWSNSAITDEFGEVLYVISTGIDVTEQRKAEEIRFEAVRQYRLLFDANPQPMWVYDRLTLGFLAVNDAAVAHYGYSRDEFLSMTIADIRPPEDVPDLLAAVNVTGDLRSSGLWRHIRKDRSEIVAEISSHLLTFDGREAVLVLSVDVTEQRRLEEGLRRAQKIEAIGRLAGGIAHDFNNMLTVILGYSELVLDRLPPADPLRADVEQIRATSRRAASLTQQLLAFGRKQIMKPKVINLNRIVTEMERMLRRVIGEGIDLRTALDPTLDLVKADPSLVEQIILNLAVNARDAMQGSGTLTIETANAILDESYVRRYPDASPGPHIMLAVSDTGAGMDDETKSHIFEPFFTTKGVGEGTGLGLASVYGTVTQSGGSIWVYSKPGEGTTIRIYLPRTHEETAPSGEHERAEIARGNETVLVTEDEEAVRHLITRTLGSAGYRVLEASDGAEALRRIAEFDGHIDLLLTDVVMPRMGGRELAGRLESEQPGIRVLYISGYTGDGIGNAGRLGSGGAFLEKPFSPAALAAKVRSVLDGEE